MIGKLLLTIGVVIAVLFFFRTRPRQLQAVDHQLQRKNSANRWIRLLAFAAIALTMLGGAAVLYFDWRATRQVVDVHVIDTRSGQRTRYQAYRGEIGERSFTTIDGRQVNIAETERMESGTVTLR